MLENGYIKLYRSMLSWEWYDSTETVRLFLHLLLTANYEPKNWRGVEIERGQRLCSIATLSAETNLSPRTVRTCIERLISTGEVTKQTNPQHTIITIKNYDTYQTPTNETTNERQTSDKRPTNDRQLRKKDKNDKNDKKERKEYISSFDSFWNAYPKKKAKQDAQRAWGKLKPDEALADTIIASVLRFAATKDWTKDGGQFVPYPATFLNGRRWEDETQSRYSNLERLHMEMEALDEQG